MQIQLMLNRCFRDLNPLLYGSEACRAGHTYGPAIRSYHLLHYVEYGKGVYETDGVRYPVSAGEAFLILPGKVTIYTADSNDPWRYRWIGFNGELATLFDQLPPVFRIADSIFPRYEESAENEPEYRLASALFRLCAELFAEKDVKKGTIGSNHYVKRAQEYVRLSYMSSDLRVEEIAQQMNLDRRYLSRLFRHETGQTIQSFLISVRMEAADHYLRQGMSVGEAAQLCGYSDVFNFSKMFKKIYGISPVFLKRQVNRPLSKKEHSDYCIE